MSANFVAAVTVGSDFGAQENKICHCFHFFPFYLPWSDEIMILVFWMLNFKPVFSLLSLTLIKRLFSSFLLSAIRVLPFAYLRLLIFLLAILISACHSSTLAFRMYSAQKLNKQGDNIQPCHTPFPTWKQSVVPCPILTVTSWSAYRFLKRLLGGLVHPTFKEFSTHLLSSTQAKALA